MPLVNIKDEYRETLYKLSDELDGIAFDLLKKIANLKSDVLCTRDEIGVFYDCIDQIINESVSNCVNLETLKQGLVKQAEGAKQRKQDLYDICEKFSEINEKLDSLERQDKFIQYIYFVIDTSQSMNGPKIDTLNSSIEELIPELVDVSECNVDTEIKFAVLSYSTGARWELFPPVQANDFSWNNLEAFGTTDFGEACYKLNKGLPTLDELFDGKEKTLKPIIFVFTDGSPTDEYLSKMKKLKDNIVFKISKRYGIAIGEEANREVLKDFVESSENLISVHTPEALKKFISFDEVNKDYVISD